MLHVEKAPTNDAVVKALDRAGNPKGIALVAFQHGEHYCLQKVSASAGAGNRLHYESTDRALSRERLFELLKARSVDKRPVTTMYAGDTAVEVVDADLRAVSIAGAIIRVAY